MVAAEKSGLPLDVFAIHTVLPVSIAAITVMAIAAYFWNKILGQEAQHANGKG